MWSKFILQSKQAITEQDSWNEMALNSIENITGFVKMSGAFDDFSQMFHL